MVQEVKRKKRLYYKLLSPVELRTIISEKGNQGSYSVRMKRATDRDVKKIELELLQFERDCKKQISFADSAPIVFSDLQKQGIHSFSMDVAVRNKKESFLVAVTKEPVFLYANYENDVKVPLGLGRASISLLRDVEEPVKVGETIYYDRFKSKMEGGMLTVSVGECFKITLDPTGKKKQATLNMGRRATMLKDVITEAEFILALQKHKEITVGALTLPIPFPDKHELTEGLDENLKAWHKLDDVLTRISCNKDIDLSLVKKKDEVTIDNLKKNRSSLSLQEPTIHYDVMACADYVIDKAGVLDEIAKMVGMRKLCAVDMESYAIFRVGQILDVETMVIKSVMDLTNNKSDKYKPYAAYMAANYLYHLLYREEKMFE